METRCLFSPLTDAEVEWSLSGYMALTALPWERWRALLFIRPLLLLLGCCSGLESPPWKPISLTVSAPHILPKSHHSISVSRLHDTHSCSSVLVPWQSWNRKQRERPASCTLTYYPQCSGSDRFYQCNNREGSLATLGGANHLRYN